MVLKAFRREGAFDKRGKEAFFMAASLVWKVQIINQTGWMVNIIGCSLTVPGIYL